MTVWRIALLVLASAALCASQNISDAPEPPVSLVVLDNTTSSTLTLAWFQGDPGTSPPQTFSLSMKAETQNEFEDIDTGIPESPSGRVYYTVYDLPAETTYEFRVYASTTSGQSEYAYVAERTTGLPRITPVSLDVTDTEMTVTWTNDDGRGDVSVIFQYKTAPGTFYTQYPRDDKIDANDGTVVISGYFDPVDTYVARIEAFEGNLTQHSMQTLAILSAVCIYCPCLPDGSAATLTSDALSTEMESTQSTFTTTTVDGVTGVTSTTPTSADTGSTSSDVSTTEEGGSNKSSQIFSNSVILMLATYTCQLLHIS